MEKILARKTIARLIALILLCLTVLPVLPAANAEGSSPVLVAYGDSIAAAGTWESYFKQYSGETVLNSGVGGDTSKAGLARFSSAVKAKNADVVFIGFGTNDCSIDMDRYIPLETYADNLRSMIAKVRETGAVPVVITPPPIVDGPYLTRHQADPFLPYNGPNGLLEIYAQAARAVAREQNVTCADVHAAFSAEDYGSLISDGVHPNSKGYQLYAKTVLDAYYAATRGDLDMDGELSVIDYVLLRRSILGTATLTKAQEGRADITGDGDRTSAANYILLKRAVLGTASIDRGVPCPEGRNGLLIEANLIPDSKAAADMAANTAELQSCVDRAAEAGGGTVLLPTGTFYFSTQGMNARKFEDYVCMPKDNVLVEGQGELTVLQPVGNTQGGLDMFYYNTYADTGTKKPVYLVNADFKNFVIDGGLAHAARYTSAGKGFMFNLFKDCDFDHIVCKNTDGTGFGVDCPINCTITNCRAYGCGKAATTSNVGASGFGIGTGYAENESILISRCYAEGNMKFGFFFEHQGRFNPTAYTAQKLGECVVSDCAARNNFNDFGGELALDLKYVNCTVPADTTSVQAIAFRLHCIRCTLEDMHVYVEFGDVTDKSADYYEAVYWAVNKGITTGYGNNKFDVSSPLTKGQALTFLYRAAGMPGELILGNGAEGKYYEDAFAWAAKTGLTDESMDAMNDPMTRNGFVTCLWKYAGSPAASGSSSAAVNWGLANGLIPSAADAQITRAEAVSMLYKCLK